MVCVEKLPLARRLSMRVDNGVLFQFSQKFW